MSVDVSLIVPAFNEEQRLPGTLAAAYAYLRERPWNWELLVADDGSEDRTPEIVRAWSERDRRIRLLRLPHRGKAAAVRSGVLAAAGTAILFTDADLSTPIEYLEPALQLLREGWDLVIGSREGALARRIGEPWHRHAMGRVYNRVVQWLLLPGIDDTQCGFKGFRREVALDLFHRMLLYRDGQRPLRGPRVTGFDVELLYIARRRGYRIAILPVTWRHVEGSKVRPFVDALLMLRDVVSVRINAWRGAYDGDVLPLGERLPGD
ncbi:MAG: glycosyltransferase family 2 protein [Thermomicrobium sp.]|nr:glycosyltransferase family 2 protein [Thermomicrobium sp.]MDW8058769.1 glycosyltransferase family 2 protein [Thermomicrobium sp.]